jgi:methylamine dehydrogenase heavy chain
VHSKNALRIPLVLVLAHAWTAAADVPIDRIPNSLSLPDKYPENWVYVYAVNYPAALGSYAIVDVAAESKQYKGQFQGAFYPSLIDPVSRSELYVAESFFEQVGHGKRTDVVTVTEKDSLNPVAEIVLPGMKRGIMDGTLMDVTRDAALILVFNFSPASSVTVVDAKKRRVVSEVPIPGCTSIYATGSRGFSSLCADGSLTTFNLGPKGQVLSERRKTQFNDIDNDALYLQPTSIGSTTYFVSVKGNIRPVDMINEEPQIYPPWPLMAREEAADGWRTASGLFAASDESGDLYVRLFRETGYDKQANDNTEVWVFDVPSHKRIRRIPLKNGANSIDVTKGKKPYLVVVAASDPSVGESIDVYDASTGNFVRTIGGWPQGTFLSLVQAKR